MKTFIITRTTTLYGDSFTVLAEKQTALEVNSLQATYYDGSSSLLSMKHLEDVGLHEPPPLQRV